MVSKHTHMIYIYIFTYYKNQLFYVGKIYQSHGSSGEWYVTKVFPRLKNGRKPPKPVTIPVAAPTKRRNPSELSESRPGRREARLKFCGAVPTHHWFTQKERLLIRIRLEECTTCPDLVENGEEIWWSATKDQDDDWTHHSCQGNIQDRMMITDPNVIIDPSTGALIFRLVFVEAHSQHLALT